MTQVTSADVGTSPSFEQVGTGLNVYQSADPVEGVARWLETPEDVIAFADGSDVSDVVVIARGGATTFLTMALNAGVRGVVTLQGAPESHLGILCREYGIPCLMSVAFSHGVRTSRGEIIPADGVRIPARRLHLPAGHGQCGGRCAGRRLPTAGCWPGDDRGADGADPAAAGEVPG